MVSYNSKQNSDFTEKRGKTMFFKKLAAMFAAVFGFAASLVTVYAGDNSIGRSCYVASDWLGRFDRSCGCTERLGQEKEIRKVNKRSDVLIAPFFFSR